MDTTVPGTTTIYPVQPAIWPQREISTEVPAHFFLTGPVGLKLDESGAEFGPGGYLATSPYYNIFNLGKWSRHAGRIPLQLQLEGQGRFLLSVRLASPNKSEQQLISEEIQLHGTLRRAVDLGETVPREALVFFELIALADARLDDFAWVTTAPTELGAVSDHLQARGPGGGGSGAIPCVLREQRPGRECTHGDRGQRSEL